jgi:hypothetical protein
MSSNACFITMITAISSGARPALPMGVAPEAIVEKKSSIDSKIFTHCLSCIAISCIKICFLFFLSGAQTALPIRVAPKAMSVFLGNDHSLRSFFDLGFL